MAAAYSDNESQDEQEDDGEYGGISEKTLRFIGVKPSEQASTADSTTQPTRIDQVIKMLISSQAKNEDDTAPLVDAGESPNKGRRLRAVKSRLPRELQGLMGEANLKFARGEYEEVMMMCQEVIKSAPTAPEPYQTLSMLHEEMGDNDNAYQFGLVAAHLDPRNTQEWLRLAEMAMESGNLKECASCYWQVAKHDRENTEALLESAQLEIQLGEHRKAADVLKWILDSDNANSNSGLYMSVTKELAKHSRGKRDAAIKVLETSIERHPEYLTSEEVNLLAEFYVVEGCYPSIIELLTNHCGVVCALDSDVVVIPRELPLDLRSKLTISLCYDSRSNDKTIKDTLREFDDENVDDVGDLMIDISEALQENGFHSLALPIIERLVHTDKYGQAAVWLKYSECLSALGRLREAADAYGSVVEMAPNHVAARVQLSLLQQQMGLDKEALHTLAEGGVSASSVRNDWTGLEGKEPRLLLHTCLLLLSQDKQDEYFRYVQYLLFGQLPPHVIIEHETALMGCRAVKGRNNYLKKILPDFETNYKLPPAVQGGENALTELECWEMFNQACEIANRHKKFDTLFVLTKSAFCSWIFYSKKLWCEEVDFKIVCSHILLSHGGSSFDIVREAIMRLVISPDETHNQVMNIFSMITSLCPHDVRFSRFSARLLKKHPTSIAMNIAHGHASIIFSSYRAAINQYITACKLIGDKNPSPLLNLLIGICFLNIVCMKFTTQRATLAVQGVCFLDRYMKQRGHCQEVYYNLGRAMQQISINSAAVYYYRKCIDTPPILEGDNFDLTKDATFNLSLIYQASGSSELAEHVLQTYCVV